MVNAALTIAAQRDRGEFSPAARQQLDEIDG